MQISFPAARQSMFETPPPLLSLQRLTSNVQSPLVGCHATGARNEEQCMSPVLPPAAGCRIETALPPRNLASTVNLPIAMSDVHS